MTKLKIGVLEMSNDSTEWYLNRLAKSLNELEISKYPTNFEAINQLLPQPSVALFELLNSFLPNTNDLSFLLVPNITIHVMLDELFLEHQHTYSLVHPLSLTIERLRKNRVNEVVIFGSYYTMRDGYVSKKMELDGVSCSFPSKEDILSIDACRKAVFQNKASAELISNFKALVQKYAKMNTVVLACTELSMAYNGSMDNVLDMAQMQIDFCAQLVESN
tara:strand:+ start:42723 stop:43379 length:657 start_codon:yes stop_codon:yes gene_type:complete